MGCFLEYLLDDLECFLAGLRARLASLDESESESYELEPDEDELALEADPLELGEGRELLRCLVERDLDEGVDDRDRERFLETVWDSPLDLDVFDFVAGSTPDGDSTGGGGGGGG